MIREASAMYRVPVRVEAPTEEDMIKGEILGWFMPANPHSNSFDYLSRFENRHESFLEQLTFTVLVRYADYLADADKTYQFGSSLDTILSNTDRSINDLTHDLIALIYPDPFPEDNQNEIIPTGEHLDISEFEATLAYRHTLIKVQEIPNIRNQFGEFIKFSSIGNANLPPVDTIITATMVQFAIDLALEQDEPYEAHMPDVRRTLAPLLIYGLDTDFVLPRMRQISQFIGERIQYL